MCPWECAPLESSSWKKLEARWSLPTLKELAANTLSSKQMVVKAASLGFVTFYELGRKIKRFNSFSANYLNS